MMGLLGWLLMLLEELMMTEEDLLLEGKVFTSSIPPSSDDEGTGEEEESDEVVDGVNGQTTSFRSFRSSSCREYFYILAFGREYFHILCISWRENDHLQLCGNHVLNGVDGVGQLGQGLGLMLTWASPKQSWIHYCFACDYYICSN